MTEKLVAGECSNCESTFEVAYEEELVSSELPECCPFCGETIDNIVEEEPYEENDDDLGDLDSDKWD